MSAFALAGVLAMCAGQDVLANETDPIIAATTPPIIEDGTSLSLDDTAEIIHLKWQYLRYMHDIQMAYFAQWRADIDAMWGALGGGNQYTDSLTGGVVTRADIEDEEVDFAEELDDYLATLGEINPTNVAVVSTDFSMAAVYEQDAMQQMSTAAAHDVATGDGVLVAVIDSGFNWDHPFLEGKLTPTGYDAIDHDMNPTDGGNGIDDDFDGHVDNGIGHGTMVSGLILAAAPDVTILPIRALDDEGWAFQEEIASAIYYAIDMNVDAINLSLEAGEEDFMILQALADANTAGIHVIVSAGNNGLEALGAIAGREASISVGTVDGVDRQADFSNNGNDDEPLSVLAPGVDLLGPHGFPEDESMCIWSGTSFSCGFVTGAVALLLELDPAMSTDSVIDKIRTSTDTAYMNDGFTVHPAGRLNLSKVVEE